MAKGGGITPCKTGALIATSALWQTCLTFTGTRRWNVELLLCTHDWTILWSSRHEGLILGFDVHLRRSSVGSISSGSSSQLRLPLVTIGKKLLLVI